MEQTDNQTNMKTKEVFNGWLNLLFKNEQVEKLAEQRAELCYRCKHRKFTNVTIFLKSDFYSIQDYICNLCKCPLSAKIRSINSKCDANKW